MTNNILARQKLLFVLCWGVGVILLTYAVDAALLRSKDPAILYWSGKKLVFILGTTGLGLFALRAARFLRPENLYPFRGSNAPASLFLSMLSLVFISYLAEPATADGDLGYQMEGLRQFVDGEVAEFNSLSQPIKDWDLARDRVDPIVWYPPGPMILLLPLMKAGLSPGWAARILMLLAFACGGLGFLRLAEKMGLTLSARLAFATCLGLAPLCRDGLGIGSPTSADNLGLAAFPWLVIANLSLLQKIQAGKKGSRFELSLFLLLGLGTGGLYYIKYSWFVAGATLAAFTGLYIFLLLRKILFSRRIAIMAIYSIGFIAPFLTLNHHNRVRSGDDALGYSKKTNIGDNSYIDMVYGPNFSATASPEQLPFSLLAGPGYILGGNILTTMSAHMARQDHKFSHFFYKKLATNGHVWALIFLCLPMTMIALWLIRSFADNKDSLHTALLVCLTFVPLAILAYLSLQANFNFIIKDNYRYMIPYSLVFQAVLLGFWFSKTSFKNKSATRNIMLLVLFWVCIFPNVWSLRLHARRGTTSKPMNVGQHPQAVQKWIMQNPEAKHITFVLNGNGSRTKGFEGRVVPIPFILNGGLEQQGNHPYHTSEPIRIFVAVEKNVVQSKDIGVQEFLEKKFPVPIEHWKKSPFPDSPFPVMFFADLSPDHH